MLKKIAKFHFISVVGFDDEKCTGTLEYCFSWKCTIKKHGNQSYKKTCYLRFPFWP